MERINYFTGKPEPVLQNSDFYNRETDSKCEHCNTNLIDNCMWCGAPVCCPKCCAESRKNAEEGE